MKKKIIIYMLLGIISLCCGCSRSVSNDSPKKMEYPTIIRDVKSDDYGNFGVGDIMLGVKSDNWVILDNGMKGAAFGEDFGEVYVVLDDDDRVIYLRALFYDEQLAEHILHIDDISIDSFAKYNELVANNTIREDENVEYVDGKVGYRTRIIKKGVDSSDYEDILEAQIWWIPDYKHSELLE